MEQKEKDSKPPPSDWGYAVDLQGVPDDTSLDDEQDKIITLVAPIARLVGSA